MIHPTPLLDRNTNDVHIAAFGYGNYMFCGNFYFNFPDNPRYVATSERALTCEKCKEACRELITTLQACMPDEVDYSLPQYDI